MNNICDDISSITDLPKTSINKVLEICCDCFLHSIYENKQKMIFKTQYKLGNLGVISVLLDKDTEQLKCTFSPSERLLSGIQDVYKNNTDYLLTTLEKSVVDRLTNAYKDLL